MNNFKDEFGGNRIAVIDQSLSTNEVFNLHSNNKIDHFKKPVD